VTHFGQTPSQLLTREHPRKLPKDDCIEPLCADLSTISKIRLFTPASKLQGSSNGAVIAISCYADRLVACHANLSLSFYRWNAFPEDDNSPFTLKADRLKVLPCAALSSSEEILRGRSSLLQSLSLPSADPSTGGTPPQALHKQSSESGGGGIFEAFRKHSPFTKSRSTSIYTGTKESFEELFTTATARQEAVSSRSTLVGSSPLTACRTLSHMNVAMNIGEAGMGRIVTCGYWDNSLKVHSLETMRDIATSKLGHQGGITCLQQGGTSDAYTVITGGVDGTCRVWIFEKGFLASAYAPDPYFAEIDSEEALGQGAEAATASTTNAATGAAGAANSPLYCVHILWGHQSPVRCLSYSSVLDMCLSGGEDGRLCLHSVRTGKYIRSITHCEGSSTDLVVASAQGYLVAHSWSDLNIHVFWLNGQHLLSTTLPCRYVPTLGKSAFRLRCYSTCLLFVQNRMHDHQQHRPGADHRLQPRPVELPRDLVSARAVQH
jgi:WD40 repeat protein